MNDTATATETATHVETELGICVGRSLKYFETDKAAVWQIAQAAIDVELFTIPLYMTAMYSIYGTHEINAKNIDYYQGRCWPGMAPTAHPDSEERKTFNLIFSVFIQEMLHLEMAANISTAIGLLPTFTSPALQTPDHGWHCYGPDRTTIPYIVDLRDTKRYHSTKVALGSLDKNTLDLFCAIEQPTRDARREILPGQHDKYFPRVPFLDWNPGKPLPMFGSIGDMYECYAKYLRLRYEDGKTLWEKLFTADGVQQDLFNVMEKGHPKREFPGFETRLSPQDLADPIAAFDKAITMMSAITDQGEGSLISIGESLLRYRFKPALLTDVKERYREDRPALDVDYPSYNASGGAAPSADAEARAHYAPETHYERFESLRGKLDQIMTWEKWHADRKNHWTAAMLTTQAYSPPATSPIPLPQEVADALNRLKAKGPSEHALLSKVAVGAIAGVTTVLNEYWKKASTTFPYPSMAGSGDRVSLCWAVFGMTPDLALGIGHINPNKLYHACQGMALEGNDEACAAIEVYHTCRGSNGCKAQGGCGFAQLDSGGGSCGHSGGCGMTASVPDGHAPYMLRGRKSRGDAAEGNLCGGPQPATGPYSSPSDNKCLSFGGCAVPISASQLYPSGGTMTLYDFVGPGHQSKPIGSMTFALGDSVYQKAWEAYQQVMSQRGKSVGTSPKPTDLRIALPPST